MKTISRRFLVFGALLFIGVCGLLVYHLIPKGINSDYAEIGLVVTTAQKYDSHLLCFDKDLKRRQDKKLKYAMLGTAFYQPAVNKNELYLIPQGLGDRKDTRKVISIDKSTLDIEEYPFSNIALNHMACIGDNVYTINTLNGCSYLESYNSLTEERKIVEMEGVYFEAIFAISEKLFCFTSSIDEESTEHWFITLDIYNKELDLEEEKDFSMYGHPTKKYCENDDYVYLTVNYDEYDNPVGKIVIVDKNTGDIQEYKTKNNYPNDIFLYGEELIVTYYDPVQLEGTSVAVWKHGKEETLYDLGVPLTVTAVKDDKFIVANNTAIYSFSIPKFELIEEEKIEIPSGYYVSNLLIFDD